MHGSELNRRAVESLIKSGAFDSIEATRRGMMDSVESILKSIETDARRNVEGQLDLFSALAGGSEETASHDFQIPPKAEYPLAELLQLEKEVSGLYLSGHPLDGYRELINKIACPIKDLIGENAHQYDNKQVSVVCVLTRSKFMTTKSNTLMAFINVEDLTGTMEIIVFPKVLEKCRDSLQENQVLIIEGRVSCREEENAKLLAEHISTVPEYEAMQQQARSVPQSQSTAQPKSGKPGIYLLIPTQNCPQFDKVKNLMAIFEGRKPVYIKFADTGKWVVAPRNLWVTEHALLLQELKNILGDENVVSK